MINIFADNKISKFVSHALFIGSLISSIIYALYDKSIEGFGLYISLAAFICMLLSLLAFRFYNIKFANSLYFFGLLHTIIFPLIYIGLLRHDSKCFVFDRDISANRKAIAIDEIKSKYNYSNSTDDYKLLSGILDENSRNLDYEVKRRQSNLVSFINTSNYIIKITPVRQDDRGGAPLPTHSIVVYSKINKYQKYTFGSSRKPLRELLVKEKDEIQSLISGYEIHYKRIQNGDIWTYSSLLPYSINIFWNGNMVPASDCANYANFIHNLFVFIFILSIISTTISYRREE